MIFLKEVVLAATWNGNRVAVGPYRHLQWRLEAIFYQSSDP
jgi:hypothetical protein